MAGAEREDDRADAIRVRIDEGGPILVPGPVEMDLPDGTRVRSDRPVVAICACRRSRRWPICDTSHRRKERAPRPAAGAAPEAQAGTGETAPVSEERPAAHDAER